MNALNFKIEKAESGNYVLDVRGLVCPYPLLLILKTLENMDKSEILEVILDNQPSVDTIPSELEKKGHKVLELSKIGEADWRLIMRKGG